MSALLAHPLLALVLALAALAGAWVAAAMWKQRDEGRD